MSTLPAPPETDDVQSPTNAVPSVRRTTTEKVLGGIGRGADILSGVSAKDFGESMVGKLLDEHYQQRLNDARRHYVNKQAYAEILHTGIGPNGKELSDEERADYERRLEGATQDFAKAAGVNKDIKAQIEQQDDAHKTIYDATRTHGTGVVHGLLSRLGVIQGGKDGAAAPAEPPDQNGVPAQPMGKPATSESLGVGKTGMPTPPPYDVADLAPMEQGQARSVTGQTATGIKSREQVAQAIGLAPKPGEQPSTEYQRFMIEGKMPASTSLQLMGERVPGKNVPPNAVTLDGTPIDPNGFYRLQREPYSGTVIATTASLTAGQVTPQRISYMDANGKHVMGWAANGVYQDDQHKPLPAGTQVFDPSLQTMTTVHEGQHFGTDVNGNQTVTPTTTTSTRLPASLRAPQGPTGARAVPRTLRVKNDTADVQSKITDVAGQVGVDPAFAMAVAKQESGFDQTARNKRSGAIGVFQLMPPTADDLDVDPKDENDNIVGGVSYLKQLTDQYGADIPKVLAAYDWGMGHVDKAVAQYGPDWLAHAPKETQDYVRDITASIDANQGQGAGGRVIPASFPPPPTPPQVPAGTPTGGTDGAPSVAPATAGATAVPTSPRLAAVPRAGIGQTQLVNGPDGKPLHKPLSALAKQGIGQATISLDLIDQIMPELDDIVSGGDKNKLWDSAEQRSAWEQYTKLGVDPSQVSPDSVISALPNIDHRLAKLFPTIAMLQVVGAQPWLRNIRRFEFLQQVQQHLPDPAKDTPRNMISKLDTLSNNMPNLIRAAYEEEGIEPDPYKGASVAEVKKFAEDSGKSYADVAHGLRRGGYKITRSGK